MPLKSGATDEGVADVEIGSNTFHAVPLISLRLE
jgi:hypothetical protein